MQLEMRCSASFRSLDHQDGTGRARFIATPTATSEARRTGSINIGEFAPWTSPPPLARVLWKRDKPWTPTVKDRFRLTWCGAAASLAV